MSVRGQTCPACEAGALRASSSPCVSVSPAPVEGGPWVLRALGEGLACWPWLPIYIHLLLVFKERRVPAEEAAGDE